MADTRPEPAADAPAAVPPVAPTPNMAAEGEAGAFGADWQRSIDVIDGDLFVSWDDQTTVSRVSASDGKAEAVVAKGGACGPTTA